jgi:hypothetical protein
MRYVARLLAVLAVLLVTAGCDVEQITLGGVGAGAVPERWEPWIETDRTTYVARYTAQTVELTIGFRFENRSRLSAAVPRCTQPHRPVLDKLVFGEWVEVFTPIEGCWGEPFVIGPRRAASFTFRVQAGRPHTFHEPQFRTSHIPGIYRLRWDVYEYDPFSQFRVGAPFPIEHRVSNEFRIIH